MKCLIQVEAFGRVMLWVGHCADQDWVRVVWRRFNVGTFGGEVQYWQADLTMATKDILASLGDWLSSIHCHGNTRLLEAIQVGHSVPPVLTSQHHPTPHPLSLPLTRLLWTAFPHARCTWCQMVGWTTVKSSSSNASSACPLQLYTQLPSAALTGGPGPHGAVLTVWESTYYVPSPLAPSLSLAAFPLNCSGGTALS